MTRRRFVKISKRIASAAICTALILLCVSCKAGKTRGALKGVYKTLESASSLEYEKRVETVLITARGSYEMEYSVSASVISNGNSVNEIYARQMDKEVSFTTFGNAEYTYTPLYSDFYVRSETKRIPFSDLSPYPDVAFYSEKEGFFGEIPVYIGTTDSESVISYIKAQLIGSVNIADFAGVKWEEADFGTVTAYVAKDAAKKPFFALEGSFEFKEKGVFVDYSVEFEVYSVNSLLDVVFPLEEGKLDDIGSYEDFIESLNPIADLITQSQWAVLLGYTPENEFDFYSFEFDEYVYPLYWEAFFEVIL